MPSLCLLFLHIYIHTYIMYQHCINSDGFFEIDRLPKRVAVIGAGYIAVELAGILNALGVDTHLFVR